VWQISTEKELGETREGAGQRQRGLLPAERQPGSIETLIDGDAGAMKAMEMSVDWLSPVREGTFLIFGVDTYMEAELLAVFNGV
jgi:hypothetical protein